MKEEDMLIGDELNLSYKQIDPKMKLKELIDEKRVRGESPLLRGRNLVPSLTPTLINQKKIQDTSFQFEKQNEAFSTYALPTILISITRPFSLATGEKIYFSRASWTPMLLTSDIKKSTYDM